MDQPGTFRLCGNTGGWKSAQDRDPGRIKRGHCEGNTCGKYLSLFTETNGIISYFKVSSCCAAVDGFTCFLSLCCALP